jgi:FAD synthetase
MSEQLVTKYLKNTEKVFEEIRLSQMIRKLDGKKILYVLDLAKSYLKDGKFYKENGKFETALASVVYCEGLLDALRLLGLVEFQWPT